MENPVCQQCRISTPWKWQQCHGGCRELIDYMGKVSHHYVQETAAQNIQSLTNLARDREHLRDD